MQLTSAQHDTEAWRRPAEPASVPDLRHEVVDFAESLGLDPRAIGDIALAVTEAVSNVVVHAYDSGERGPVEVQADYDGFALVLRVIDAGHGMLPRRTSPGLGLGLPIIGEVADRLEICELPRDAGVELTMTFREALAAA
jgi:serine/threonine-protein kinase RsbW/stage II sporulation protein AB (anti-sigma F factor)